MLNYSRTIFTDIIQEVIYTENVKKTISQEILMVKNDFMRQQLIYNFLSYELDKHEILEQAAILAVENGENYLLKQLELFYKHCEGLGLLDKIRAEITHTELFLETVEKGIEDFDSISFVERRLIKEINKYVVTQARYYSHFKPELH